jgi:tight adherence protein C
MNITFDLALGSTIFCVLGLLFSLAAAKTSQAANHRVLQVTRAADIPEIRKKAQVDERLLRVLRAIRGRLGISEDARLRERFTAAGLKSSQSIERYFAARMLFPVAGILAGSFIQANPLLAILGFVVAGYLLPDFWLDRRIKKRRERIRKSIPDSIDLIVICVDAGLGLDQAMLRTGQELILSHPEINEEFLQINREQRAGKPRIDAWRSMAIRTKLPDVEAFVSMLVQTERFGTPITRALSTFADDLRLRRRQLAEERAAKTTVKIMFPLVMFIFPCIFIVLLGPAIIGMSHMLKTLMK